MRAVHEVIQVRISRDSACFFCVRVLIFVDEAAVGLMQADRQESGRYAGVLILNE